MTQKLATYAPAEARALENILIKGMKRDPAATGGKAPSKTSKAFSHMTPARASARAQMDLIVELLIKHRAMTRGEILKELANHGREGIKPQLVSNWLGTMREEGRVVCTYGKTNYWRAVK